MANFIVDNISVVGMAAAVPKNKFKKDDFVKQFGEDATTKFIIYIELVQNKQPVT